MEASVAEYLVYLRQNASQLRKQAEEWGFTEAEINKCIEEALNSADTSKMLQNSPMNKLRTCVHYFRVLVKIVVLLLCLMVALITGFTALVTCHEPSARYIGSSLQNYNYEIFRVIRLATVPIHSMYNISEYYNSECLIENPFFLDDFDVDCTRCDTYRTVKTINASNFTALRFTAFSHTLKPVKIMGTLDKHVTYLDVRKMYLENHEELSSSFYMLQSNDDKFITTDDIFLDDNELYINSTEGLHIHWESQTVSMSVALRTLFPRPAFLHAKSEVNIAKHVFMDGPNKTTYKLPESAGEVNIYMQGTGARRVMLRPHMACQDFCNSLITLLNPGDVLMYHYNVWRGYVVANSDQPSVGYLISVNL